MKVLDQITHRNPNKTIANSSDILGSYQVFLNISELKSFPIEKRIQDQLVTVQYYNLLDEETVDTGSNKLLKFTGASVSNINWENYTNWSIINEDSTSGENVLDVTYDELVNKISLDELVTGFEYKIIDYKTVYVQPYTNLVSTDEISLDTTIEPLIVKAASNNTIYSEARSQMFPSDYIEYDITYTDNEAKGKITKRIIANNIFADYDIRNIKLRRYAPLVSAWNSEVEYEYSNVVLLGGSYYICKLDSSTNESPDTNSDSWYLIDLLDEYEYILSANNQFSWLTTDLSNFEDIYTIHIYNNPSSDYTLNAINGNYKVELGNLESNNAIIVDSVITNLKINGENNTIFSNNIEDFIIKNSSYNVFLNHQFESNVIDVHNSFLGGLIRSNIIGNLEGCKLLGDSESALINCNIIAKYDGTSISFDVYNRQVNVDLNNVADVILLSSNVRLTASNWENVVIPKEISFINCLFTIPQFKGLAELNTILPITYIAVNFSSYYVDDVETPTIEKIFYNTTNLNGSVQISELGRNYDIETHGIFPMQFPILLT